MFESEIVSVDEKTLFHNHPDVETHEPS